MEPSPTQPLAPGAPAPFARLFGLTAPIDRKTYVLAGFSLMALKYALDAAIVRTSPSSAEPR
jgi:hypothetical protein